MAQKPGIPSLEIKVRVDKVYGKTVIYPANERARFLAQVAGTKTLTGEVLQLARRIGLDVIEDTGPRLAEVAR